MKQNAIFILVFTVFLLSFCAATHQKKGLSISGFYAGVNFDEMIRSRSIKPKYQEKSTAIFETETSSVFLHLDTSGNVQMVSSSLGVLQKDGRKVFDISEGFKQATEKIEGLSGFKILKESNPDLTVAISGKHILRIHRVSGTGPASRQGRISSIDIKVR